MEATPSHPRAPERAAMQPGITQDGIAFTRGCSTIAMHH
jgi:hypothetical protein